MEAGSFAAAYRALAEMLLYPGERDDARVAALLARARAIPPEAGRLLEDLADRLPGVTCEEYVMTLELSPRFPLYLGCYLYEEPATCRGAGACERNGFMIELVNVYRHFGFELSGRDLPDFLPVMMDFLGISLESPVPDRLGLRRRLIGTGMLPAMPPLKLGLASLESPYASAVEALEILLKEELRSGGGDYVPLPVAAGHANPGGPPHE